MTLAAPLGVFPLDVERVRVERMVPRSSACVFVVCSDGQAVQLHHLVGLDVDGEAGQTLRCHHDQVQQAQHQVCRGLPAPGVKVVELHFQLGGQLRGLV